VTSTCLVGGCLVPLRPRVRTLTRFPALVLFAVFGLVLGTGTAVANVALTQVSSDPFTNSTSRHATEVEPDTFAFGGTIVSAFQVGRFFDGGSTDIGFATSTDGDAIWTGAFCPGSRSSRAAAASTGPATPQLPSMPVTTCG
jgi:hypothetical protein